MATPRLSTASGTSNNTYFLPASPAKGQRAPADYKPKVLRTCGSRPACLVNASVTYCGNNQIYAFGGFDQYSDEVYNHVLKLDLNTLQWTLVDNYGDIPGVRMGHTACFWKDDKMLIFGGENEHREYLSDVVIFDISSSTWAQPEVRGPIPRGRARHAACVYDEKLFILGGLTGAETPLDEICYLDLKTWTWSRSWSFVARFDHSVWVWEGRMWVFGGLGPDMERSGELYWLDLKGSPAFRGIQGAGPLEMSQGPTRNASNPRAAFASISSPQQMAATPSGYAANSSSVQVRPSALHRNPVAPGAVSSIKFHSGPNVPLQTLGSHFHAYSSGALLDFVTPAGTMRSSECNLSALELDGLQWQKLAEGPEIFDPGYRWHYCTVNEDGTKAWLLGCATDSNNDNGTGVFEEYLSDILPLDLKRFGLLGNDAPSTNVLGMGKISASSVNPSSSLSRLGVDLANMFDKPPESGHESDFIITAEKDYDTDSEPSTPVANSVTQSFAMEDIPSNTSPPIHVHRLILQSRWPHFARAYAAQMAEFHTKKMHIPEPYPVVRAFLYYLYTDSIAQHSLYCPSLAEVAGMLVMANIYDMPQLRLLCIHRLSRELDIESAASVWERASTAGEYWLKRRAASFCLLHWGRLVRTEGFRRLSRAAFLELCEVTDVEARVVGGEELEAVGGLGGGKFGVGGSVRGAGRESARERAGPGTADDQEEDEDEGMEIG